MKKFISIIITIAMLIFGCVVPFSAFAMDDYFKQVTIDNFRAASSLTQNYSVSTAVELSKEVDATKSSVQKTYNGKTYYGNGKELYKIIRSKLLDKQDSFTIRYYTSRKFIPTSYFEISSAKSRLSDTIYTLHCGATDEALSTYTYDGDYLRWSIYQLGVNECKLDKKTSGGYYYYTMELAYTYLLDQNQEAKLDRVIDSYVTTLRKKKLSDYELIKEIHDYICNSTTYDYDAIESNSPKGFENSYSAYGALITGECVCQGYALAFYRICRELGYSVRFSYSDLHAWNLIKLDKNYYFVDCTWDDEAMDAEDPEDVEFDEYYYFLVNEKTLLSFDGYENAHTLSDDFTDDSAYVEKYEKNYAKNNYDADADSLISTVSISLSDIAYIYSGSQKKPSVKLLGKNGNTLVQNTDYSLSYSNCVGTGRATVKIKGIGDYSGMSTQRTYIITPAKMTKPSIVSSSRGSSSLAIKWTKPDSNVSGYVVQMYKSGEWKTIKTIKSSSTTQCTIDGLKPNTDYKLRICSYKNISRIKRYGAYSSTLDVFTRPSKVKGVKLSQKSKSITVKWSSVRCSGYEIKYSLSSDFKNAKYIKVSSSKTSKTLKSLKKGKKYYIKVRAYRTNKGTNGKTYYYYGEWSAKKSATLK